MSNLLSDPTIPPHDHVVWCRAHGDGGFGDQTCETVPAELRPAGHPAGDPQTIRLSVVQAQTRGHDDPGWVVEAPRVELRIFLDLEVGWACSDVSLAEARQVAAGLLNLCDLAEAETGRCAR